MYTSHSYIIYKIRVSYDGSFSTTGENYLYFTIPLTLSYMQIKLCKSESRFFDLIFYIVHATETQPKAKFQSS